MAVVWRALTDAAALVADVLLGNTKPKLVLLGLDNSGKTTLVQCLLSHTLVAAAPTQWPQPPVEYTTGSGQVVSVVDVGGIEHTRRLWPEVTQAADGIVFMVDISDRDRMTEARAALDAVRALAGTEDMPIVVIGNKADHPAALSEAELRAALALEDTAGKDTPPEAMVERPIEVFTATLVRRQGYGEAVEWITRVLAA